MRGFTRRLEKIFKFCPSTIDPTAIKPSERIQLKDLYALYESGKSRRYGLLFSVNGGAFAIVTFLLKDAKIDMIPLRIKWIVSGLIASAMISFTFLMGKDIYNFGMKMSKLGEPLGLFGEEGRTILGLLCFLLIAIWTTVLLLSIASLLPSIAKF